MSYDPAVGRFIQQDPDEFDAGDPNLYRFVGNDPTNYRDPSGLFGEPNNFPGLNRPRSEIDDYLNLLLANSTSPADYADKLATFWNIEKAAREAADKIEANYRSQHPGASDQEADDINNAAKHAIGMALLMAIYKNEDLVTTLGNIHEFHAYTPVESGVDEYNNAKGRELAKNYKGSTVFQDLVAYFSSVVQAKLTGDYLIKSRNPAIDPRVAQVTKQQQGRQVLLMLIYGDPSKNVRMIKGPVEKAVEDNANKFTTN